MKKFSKPILVFANVNTYDLFPRSDFSAIELNTFINSMASFTRLVHCSLFIKFIHALPESITRKNKRLSLDSFLHTFIRYMKSFLLNASLTSI